MKRDGNRGSLIVDIPSSVMARCWVQRRSRVLVGHGMYATKLSGEGFNLTGDKTVRLGFWWVRWVTPTRFAP